MTPKLKVAVADDEPDMRDFFEKFIPRLGHELVAVAADGAQLVEHCRRARPDLVIADVKMPGLDGLDAVEAIQREAPVSVVLVTAHSDPEFVERAQAVGVQAYLVKPVTEKDLGPAIALARRQFEQAQALRKESADLRQALEDRKAIERAKGVVVKRLGVPEEEAFRKLRKFASDRNRKLVEVAQGVLHSEEVFHALEQS
jgi:response regulator NasT